MKIAAAHSLRGIVELPGDKSISHRAAMIAAISEGTTHITNYSPGADCSSTLACLLTLGVAFDRNEGQVSITGVGKGGLKKPVAPLDCGNSGTTMRLLAGIVAGQSFETVMVGDDALSRRPMRRIIEPLEKMRAVILSDESRAPLTIRGGKPLAAISYSLPVASAQVKSCILLAGLFAEGRTTVIEPAPTRDHTERMLQWFGSDIVVKGPEISLLGEQKLMARNISVPGDISAAAFLMTAAACLDGSEVLFPNVGLNPTRTAILDVLRKAGADIAVTKTSDLANEPAGDVRIRGGLRKDTGLMIDGELAAALIDELPVLAVLGTQLDGGIVIRGAGELRFKESDRIAAMGENLRRMGAALTICDDGMRVEHSKLAGNNVDAFGDHRVAMAMAVAGVISKGNTEIAGAECVDVSFPGFFEILTSLVTIAG